MKQAVIRALESGAFRHEMRTSYDEKNLLGYGEVTVSQVVKLIKDSTGTEYSCSPLHGDPSYDCHLLKTGGWYVKFYFADPHTVFISVHRMKLS
ncbi:hypothetical protein [Roseateles noduli]|uniref:hypothetical protein n=1 Tax=Roseateles noduli TaxID=2052484 RepID=UPI003D65802F